MPEGAFSKATKLPKMMVMAVTMMIVAVKMNLFDITSIL